MHRLKPTTVAAILTVVCIFSFFVNNTALIPDIMESRNIVTAREMVYDGHWLVPTMNGEFRFEKPPLPTWLTAITEYISSDSLFLQRSMAGLAACLLVVAFYLIGLRIFKSREKSLVSTFIFCTFYNVVLMGRTASWDIYAHAFMLMGIWFLMRGMERTSRYSLQFIWSGLFVGLSFMSKGPIALYSLLLPFLVSYLLFNQPRMKGKWMPFAVGAVVALIVGGWWFAYIYGSNSSELLTVTAKETSNWTSYNIRPWYYYWDFFLEAGVWAILLISSMLLLLWSYRAKSSKDYLMPFVWIIVGVILLSLVPEKKTRYLFPLMVPIGYLLGYTVTMWDSMFHDRHELKTDLSVFRFNVWLLSGFSLLAPVAMYLFAVKPGHMGLFLFVILSLFCIAVAFALFQAGRNRKPVNMVIAVLSLFMGVELLAMPVLRTTVNNPDIHSIELTRNMPELEGLPFYYNSADSLRIEIVYNAGRLIRPMDLQDTDEVKSAMPFVILTHKQVEEELPKEVLDFAKIQQIDTFDDNPRPKGNKLNRPIFVYNVAIVKSKD